MFNKWLKEHNLSEYNYSSKIFPDISDRGYWEKFKSFDLISAGEKYIDFQWPIIKASDFRRFKTDGDRYEMENKSFKRRYALVCMTLAELCENKGRFIPQIADGIFAVCEETFWGVSAHIHQDKCEHLPSAERQLIDLFAAETGATLAYIYYLLYTPLFEYCPELTRRMEYELDRRILSSYLERDDFWWADVKNHKINNWNPWIISNVMSVFLLVEKDRARLYKGIEKMLTQLQYYYDEIPNDGGCDEGPTYWGHAGAKLFDALYQLKIATDGMINFFSDGKFRRISEYIGKVYIGKAQFISFADGTPDGANSEYHIIHLLGEEIASEELKWIAADIKNNDVVTDKTLAISLRGTLFRLLVNLRIGKPECFERDNFAVLPDLQLARYINNGAFLCVKGGNNAESHNHNDVGNFVLYDNCEPVFIDAGIGVYTRQTFSNERYTLWATRSSYHNLPEINGIEQSAGPGYRSENFSATAENTEMSLIKAYDSSADIKLFNRTVIPTENGFILKDVFEFLKDCKNIKEHLITLEKAFVSNGQIEFGNGWVVLSDFDSCSVDEIDISKDERLKNAWKKDVIYRINLCYKNKENITIRCEKK